MKQQQKYCVTALNALTQMRDIVTPPCSYAMAKRVVEKFKHEADYESPYSRPQISI